MSMNNTVNKARKKQWILGAGIVLVLFAIIVGALKVSENSDFTPPAPQPKIQGESLKAVGAQVSDATVQGAVVDQKIAALEALIQQQERSRQEREATLRAEIENQQRQATQTTPQSSTLVTPSGVRIFDPSKLGSSVQTTQRANKPNNQALPSPQTTADGGLVPVQTIAILYFEDIDDKDDKKNAEAGQSSQAVSQINSRNNISPALKPHKTALFGSGDKNAQTYLPSGTWFSGITLTGMDAPTGGQAQDNPHPVLLEVSNFARLPNRFKSDVKRCYVTGQGWGDLSSERAYIRTEGLSCVRRDGQVIDIPVNGYIVGPDGKVGIRGTLVSKQGQVLQNALWTSILSAMGDVAKDIGTISVTSSGADGISILTDNSNRSTADLIRAGALSGLGETAKKLSDYYISLAEKLFPVIEINGGQKVDVVLSQGVRLLTNDTSPLNQRGTYSDLGAVGGHLRKMQ